jgi:ABC-type branched-subunit amino acid transport system ATPase component
MHRRHGLSKRRAAVDALQAIDVTKEFGGVRALRGVTLQLLRGEVQGLIGPNGSGKTTLVNVISGLTTPTGGRIVVDETPITGWPANRVARGGIARTFQNIRLFGRLSVLENVEVGVTGPRSRHKSRQSRAIARVMLEELRIAPYSGQLAGELPYGLQRRVEVARALARNPRYLLLDEPAAGMNEVESDDLRDTIKQISASRGCGVLVIDHDLRFIMALCGRVHVLNDGCTIAVDTPERIQTNRTVIEAYLGSDDAAAGPTPEPDVKEESP